MQTHPEHGGGRGGATGPQTRGPRAPAAGNPARRKVLWRGDPDGARAAAVGAAGRVVADDGGEDHGFAAERDFAAGGVQPRFDAGGDGRVARSAGGTRRRSGTRDSDPVPADEKQSGSDRRARSRQDGDRGRAGAENFGRGCTSLSSGQADSFFGLIL